ncbi:MAG: hypothetical protein AAF399_08815 [Bacteroidota bacterium]
MRFSKKTAGVFAAVMFIFGATGGFVGYRMYNKPHQDLAAASAEVQLSASELFVAFEQDEAKANAEYLDKLIEVNGTVAEITPTNDGGMVVVLRGETDMFGVSCSFLPDESTQAKAVQVGQNIHIRGLCSGYLMDVSLSRCIIAS